MNYLTPAARSALQLLDRGYSDARVAELTRLSVWDVKDLRARRFPETNTPRSGALERGVENSADASPTHAAAKGA